MIEVKEGSREQRKKNLQNGLSRVKGDAAATKAAKVTEKKVQGKPDLQVRATCYSGCPGCPGCPGNRRSS